mmetsp:Transcript_2557/g.4539  ORF Transcript_2557/g.4539 Transcript_2557/m.4539 type:complete len:86 (+) Transcript_2557:119-376(+)
MNIRKEEVWHPLYRLLTTTDNGGPKKHNGHVTSILLVIRCRITPKVLNRAADGTHKQAMKSSSSSPQKEPSSHHTPHQPSALHHY